MQIKSGSVIGIIGGGQLGRMTSLAAANLGYKTHIYCPEENSPASHYCDKITVGQYDDKVKLLQFAQSVDVITFEFENIPHETVSFLEENALVRPSWKSLEISQNRIKEKDFINDLGIKTAAYAKITSGDELVGAYKNLCLDKAILKTTELGYDGRGQLRIDGATDLLQLWQQSNQQESVLEGFVDFTKEISAIIARKESGEFVVFPIAENQHKNGILDISQVPADITDGTAQLAQQYAAKIADSLGLVGLLAVEFFVLEDGGLIVNEIAPRPHNSGHWTMDGCMTSQFEQFVRAICDLPFGGVDALQNVKMVNLIGDDIEKVSEILGNKSAKLHLYGKKQAREGRKMGHVNYLQ